MDKEQQVFAFVSAFTKRHKQAETRLPYHVNLIDELHADENAHSRILAKFLQQKTGNSRFEILESLIEYIKEKYPGKTDFRRIVVGSPQVTQEEQRIDLWVRDRQTGYAIIIENKVHWAVDQGEQLARYIDVTKDEGFAEHQIFVLYLPLNYDKNPDDQTWGNYKSSFADRYLKLSFRDDILYWLKEKVLPNVRWIDTFLRSAVEQYIDHLEGMFELRIIYKQINMELKDFIKQELGLTGAPQEDIVKLAAKQEELNKVNNQLELLKREAEKVIFRDWQSELVTSYPGYELVAEEGTRAGILIPVDDITIRVSISFDSQLYCQIDLDHLSGIEKIPPESVKAKAGRLLTRKDSDGRIWKYFPRYAYNDVYKCLIDVIEILIK